MTNNVDRICAKKITIRLTDEDTEWKVHSLHVNQGIHTIVINEENVTSYNGDSLVVDEYVGTIKGALYATLPLTTTATINIEYNDGTKLRIKDATLTEKIKGRAFSYHAWSQ